MADFDVSVTVTGDRNIVDRLSALPAKLQRRGAVAASRAAMRIALNAAKATARGFDDPDTDAAIWRNIALQNSARQGRRVGGVVMRLGVRGGARQYADTRENRRKGRVGKTYATGGSTWYWRFLELGTSRTRRQEFLVPAVMDNAQAIEIKLADGLEREIARLTPNA